MEYYQFVREENSVSEIYKRVGYKDRTFVIVHVETGFGLENRQFDDCGKDNKNIGNFSQIIVRIRGRVYCTFLKKVENRMGIDVFLRLVKGHCKEKV